MDIKDNNKEIDNVAEAKVDCSDNVRLSDDDLDLASGGKKTDISSIIKTTVKIITK